MISSIISLLVRTDETEQHTYSIVFICNLFYFYLSFHPCSSLSLIISPSPGRDDDEYSPTSDSPDNFPLGIAIQQYLAPTNYIRRLTSGSDLGAVYYSNRYAIVWSDLVNMNRSKSVKDSSGEGDGDFYYDVFYMRSPPNYTAVANIDTDSGSDRSNQYMYSLQQQTYFAGTLTEYSPRCPAYAPLSLLDGDESGEIYTPVSIDSNAFTIEFANYFAAASYECPTCHSNSSSSSFDGTVWVADIKTGEDSDLYKYAFISFNGSIINNYYYNFFSTPACPAFLGWITNRPSYALISNTRNAQIYLNLLSNLIYNAEAVAEGTLPLQTGISEYGNLFFDAAAVARIVSLFLSIFALLLMNGTWPLAVWRLSYERSARIALMMKTVGMRPYAYVLGTNPLPLLQNFSLYSPILSYIIILGYFQVCIYST